MLSQFACTRPVAGPLRIGELLVGVVPSVVTCTIEYGCAVITICCGNESVPEPVLNTGAIRPEC